MSKPMNLIAVLLICAALLPITGSPFPGASAAQLAATAPPLPLATKAFAVLGGSTVTNTGPSSVTGDLGVCARYRDHRLSSGDRRSSKHNPRRRCGRAAGSE